MSYVLQFGKYKNISLGSVPLTYLDWLIGQKWLKDPAKSAIEEYLNDPVIQRELESELNNIDEDIEY